MECCLWRDDSAQATSTVHSQAASSFAVLHRGHCILYQCLNLVSVPTDCEQSCSTSFTNVWNLSLCPQIVSSPAPHPLPMFETCLCAHRLWAVLLHILYQCLKLVSVPTDCEQSCSTSFTNVWNLSLCPQIVSSPAPHPLPMFETCLCAHRLWVVLLHILYQCLKLVSVPTDCEQSCSTSFTNVWNLSLCPQIVSSPDPHPLPMFEPCRCAHRLWAVPHRGHCILYQCLNLVSLPTDGEQSPTAGTASFTNAECHLEKWRHLEELLVTSEGHSLPVHFRPSLPCVTNRTQNAANPVAVVGGTVGVGVGLGHCLLVDRGWGLFLRWWSPSIMWVGPWTLS